MFPRHYDDLPASVIISLYEQAYNYYLSTVDTAENVRDGSLKFYDDKKMLAEFRYEMAIINIEDEKQKDIIRAQSGGLAGARLQQKIREINTRARKAGVTAKFSKEKEIKKANKNIAKVLKRYPTNLANTTRESRKILRMWETYAPKSTNARPNGVSLPPKSY
jgi:hypothetical protein